MAIFLTRYKLNDGAWAGPNINARTWSEAEMKFKQMVESLRLDGVLAETIDADTGKTVLFTPPEDDNK